jgi:hypothetical protein
VLNKYYVVNFILPEGVENVISHEGHGANARPERDEFNELLDVAWFLERLGILYAAFSERGVIGERAAYTIALEQLSDALSHIAIRYGCNMASCFAWFGELQQMLEDLNDGIVSPVLDTPVPRSKALPTDVWMERGDAVLAVERLRCLGMKKPAAAKKVIKALPGLGASEKDLLSWSAEFRKDKVPNRRARRSYQDSMEILRKRPREEIEDELQFFLEPGHFSRANPKK